MFGLFKPKSKIDVIRSEAVSFLTKNLGLSKATAKRQQKQSQIVLMKMLPVT